MLELGHDEIGSTDEPELVESREAAAWANDLVVRMDAHL